MSVGGNASQQTQTAKQNSNTVSDPWSATQPLLKEMLGDFEKLRTNSDTGDQSSALDDLIAKYKQGNPASDSYTKVGGDLINSKDYTGEVDQSTADLKSRLTDTANGKNLDLGENKYLQGLMQQVGNDAQNRVNSQFAGAGRDLSGANNIEVGRGVTQAQLPMLLNQFNTEQGRTDAAARTLNGAETGGAVTKGGLDAQRAGLRTGGAELINKGYGAGIENAQGIADAQGAKANLPYQRMGWLSQLLYPMAGFGGSSSSTGDSLTKGTKVGVDAKAKLYG